jgi:hypothetical protein
MTKSKKDSILLLVILGVFLIVGGSAYYFSTIVDETGMRINADKTATFKSSFGYSFTYPKGWMVSEKGNKVLVQDNDPEHKADPVTITQVTGSSVTTQSGKFGLVTYWYDTDSKQWMSSGLLNGTGGYSVKPGAVTPIFMTTSGLPVLKGSSSWKTDIVPLGTNKFLIIDSPGSGRTEILDPLVKTVSLTTGK